MRTLLAAVALAAAIPVAAGSSEVAHAEVGCMTSTNVRGASVICEGGKPHQAHVGCRKPGSLITNYYRHGVRYTSYRWSDAYCDLGHYRNQHWFTYS
jgi:hypothetical protein